MNYTPVDEMMKAIPTYSMPGSASRWMFWKLDKETSIVMIENEGECVTYGSDACDVAARTGLKIEYYTFGGLDVPVVSIAASAAQNLATSIRAQGRAIEFIR